MTADLVERLRSVRSSRRCATRRSSTGDLNHVILVGGSTRMPMVQELVKKLTGKEPHKGVNPDEVVGIGAAIQASIIKGETKEVLLLDVTPLSMGVETLGHIYTKLIEQNTHIPTRRSEIFSTAADNQTSVEVHVLQGEGEMADSRGRAFARTVPARRTSPPAPRGVPQIEVTFDIDANGIVNVSAKDMASGKEQAMTITGGTALPRDEIDRMVKDAEAHANDDKQASRGGRSAQPGRQRDLRRREGAVGERERAGGRARRTSRRRSRPRRKRSRARDVDAVKKTTEELLAGVAQARAAVVRRQRGQQAAAAGGGVRRLRPAPDDVVEGEVVDEGESA